ncbi:poly-gamma-glutamate hydrolase family protein [Desulfococcus sp.]|uniref:poly-gamma-glutamate hydrolase family protein n=1 Tax=Desulfococcus sp. TaxID=2025834 RepID=UPI0035931B82
MDSYSSFAEMKQHEREGRDYAILYREADSPFAIMAPHGGGIEPGTVDIADAVAGSDHTFYAFKGMKKAGNKMLHISSNRYDEPIGAMAATHARIVISVHGCRDLEEMVFIGGRHQALKQKIRDALRGAGFRATVDEVPGLRGIHPDNICNRCKVGKGVQLEISRGLREKMFEKLDQRSSRRKTKMFDAFVDAVKGALAAYEAR